MSFDDKISYLYEIFRDNLRIVVITRGEKTNELLYDHFRKIISFKSFHMSVFTVKCYDESIFVSSIFFDFSFHSPDYKDLVLAICKSQQFCLFINHVEPRDIKSYKELRTKCETYFCNEEHQENILKLSSVENEFCSRSRNADFYMELDSLFFYDIDNSYYSEFESLRHSFRKKIYINTIESPLRSFFYQV